VQKAGTSSLFYSLNQHPQLKLSIKKEIHFFDLNYQKGLFWYKRHFPLIYQRYLSGEASPYYFFHPLTAKRIYDLNPKIKLILLLRNPVDRAYSHYNMEKEKGKEIVASFEEAISLENERIGQEASAFHKDPDYTSFAYQTFSYIARGYYFKQLNNWLKYFSLNQFLILKSEDFFENPHRELMKVYHFLEIREIIPQSIEPYNQGKYPLMKPELRVRCQQYYYEDTKLLEDLLGIQFHWFY